MSEANENVEPKRNKIYMELKIPKLALLLAGISIGTFFAGYYFATYKQVGYDAGFANGYSRAVTDLYTFNSQPDKWITIDKKGGVAMMNGTNVYFIFQTGNGTGTVTLRSADNLGVKNEKGILFLMSDPIQLPTQLADAFNMHQKQYFVFQNEQNQRYVLQRQM
jgi:hypothetical protein